MIDRVLDALDAYAAEIDRDPGTDLDDLPDFAEFLTDFADLWHHAKEEEFLLPELVRHGLSWDDGPVADALRDHEQEAYLGRVLLQLGTQVAPRADEPEHRREVTSALRAYARFQRHHMQMEEALLYRRADELLSAHTFEEIERQGDELEDHRFGRARYDALHRLAEELIGRHSPAAAGKNGGARTVKPAMPALFGRATMVFEGHTELRETVEELRGLCARLNAAQAVSPVDLKRRVADFRDQLLAHFAAEEGDAYFGTMAVESPGLLGKIMRLQDEHREMATSLTRLHKFTAERPVEVSRELSHLLDRFAAHERDENALIQHFFLQDEGASSG